MATLTSGSYLLTESSIVYARFSVQNEVGWGPESDLNTIGADIRVVPHQPAQVTKVSSTTTSLSIEWTEPANGE